MSFFPQFAFIPGALFLLFFMIVNRLRRGLFLPVSILQTASSGRKRAAGGAVEGIGEVVNRIKERLAIAGAIRVRRKLNMLQLINLVRTRLKKFFKPHKHVHLMIVMILDPVL